MSGIFVVLFTAVATLSPASHGHEHITPTLINGVPVEPGTWQEVVRIISNGSACTATIVGPRTIVTAAHCASNGANARFTYKGRTYNARISRSPIYPRRDHDLAAGVTTEEIAQAKPHTIGGVATTSKRITLLGYGCTAPPGVGGNDGILRIGNSVIIGMSGFDMVSRTPGGAALCFGDSGGPAFVEENGGFLLLGVNSKGNIRDTNYNVRLDREESTSFLRDFANANGVTICGINQQCSDEPPPPDPSCQLSATPNSVQVNRSLTLVLRSQHATSATIEGTPVGVPQGERSFTPNSVGTFTARARVEGQAGKSATCEATYTVTPAPPDPERPTCTLTATPARARPGENIVLELSASGQVTSASIDGANVPVPLGRRTITRSAPGDYAAVGFVQGAGGSANCFSNYSIEAAPEPPPVLDFALVPTHCGANRLARSGVRSACLAVMTQDSSWTDLAVSRFVLVTYEGGEQEALPILTTQALAAAPGAVQGKDDLVFGTHRTVEGLAFPVVDTRRGILTRRFAGDVPLALEGRSQQGRYFLVDKLDAFGVRGHLL